MKRAVPLFPLNTVLFPGAVLPLKIFEERYKAMVGECLEGGHPFGCGCGDLSGCCWQLP
jgi:Lon protease-like protein